MSDGFVGIEDDCGNLYAIRMPCPGTQELEMRYTKREVDAFIKCQQQLYEQNNLLIKVACKLADAIALANSCGETAAWRECEIDFTTEESELMQLIGADTGGKYHGD